MVKYEVYVTESRSFTFESEYDLDSDALYDEARLEYLAGNVETEILDKNRTIFDDIVKVKPMKTRKDVWDLHNKLKDILGEELFLEEICKAMSVDDAMANYEYIARNHDIDLDDEEKEEEEEEEEDDKKIFMTPAGLCMFGEGAEDLQKAFDKVMEMLGRKKDE